VSQAAGRLGLLGLLGGNNKLDRPPEMRGSASGGLARCGSGEAARPGRADIGQRTTDQPVADAEERRRAAEISFVLKL
jgi:hypothetical protein